MTELDSVMSVGGDPQRVILPRQTNKTKASRPFGNIEKRRSIINRTVIQASQDSLRSSNSPRKSPSNKSKGSNSPNSSGGRPSPYQVSQKELAQVLKNKSRKTRIKKAVSKSPQNAIESPTLYISQAQK